MKLSKTQQELYDAIVRGVKVNYMPYSGRFNPSAYYYRSDKLKRCTAPANALIEKGIARREGGWNCVRLVLIEKSPEAAK